jgi:predicted transcriptional regulator
MKSNTQLRQESLKKVISVIREKGPISKRELQRITGFSWGNISSTITLLCEEVIISCSGKQETGLGRRL